MTTQRKATDDRLAALREKQDRLKAQLTALEARKRAEDRKREMRRAFVVGGAALAGAQADPAFRDALRKILQAEVVREGDRAVIADLLDLAPPATGGVPAAAEPDPATTAQTEAA